MARTKRTPPNKRKEKTVDSGVNLEAVKLAAEDFLRKLQSTANPQGEQLNISVNSPALSTADTVPEDPPRPPSFSNFLLGDHNPPPSFCQWPVAYPGGLPILPHPELGLPLVSPRALAALQKRNGMVEISELHPNALHAALSSNNTTMRFSVDANNSQILCAAEARKYRLTSYQDWYLCFATMMAYKLHYFPEQSMAMLAYLCYISEKATVYSFTAVLNYDEQFRLFLSMYPEHSWAVPNPALAGRFFIPSSVAVKCATCQGPHHACPVKGPAKQTNANGGKKAHCFRYQHGNCPSPCRQGYAHVCSICKGEHPRSEHVAADQSGTTHTASSSASTSARPAATGAAIPPVGPRFPQHQSRNARI